MRILFIFAGQGYQDNNLFDYFQEDQETLALMESFSSMSQLNLRGPNLPIDKPRFAQIIIGCYQLILFSKIRPFLANHQIELAGYSLGEVSAFLASIHGDAGQSIALLEQRTQLMNALISEAAIVDNYDLMSIKGEFDWDNIQTLIAESHCYIAIINSHKHLVIGGKCADLKQLVERLSSEGMRQAKFLNIHLPSHTPFYQQASSDFKQFLNKSYSDCVMEYPIINPLILKKVYTAEEERKLLAQELQQSLDWFNVCNLIKEYQYDLIVDLGPGDSMSKILGASGASFTAALTSASHYRSLNGFLQSFQQLI
ncbi:putative malonyl-CoA acyl-carrier-protein transacylase [Legionella birminghamensis]|uniref:[acyl-carrier-protein] S-malonyltransferase n=1 Tax=Legionella birminghamensis TaxID=28083 RepID=A0A378IBX7_9GAMM|nr:hypothetical protein [Legionella birminghamensis]KTC75945.1 putative malonyl-CoA acyl-carrier-protein transacylase [Legionella birminghamensis]STX32071.1 putative malonyl-CoA acyl-carrier-protein transacylase [Legionella birminghamensis]